MTDCDAFSGFCVDCLIKQAEERKAERLARQQAAKKPFDYKQAQAKDGE